VVSLEMPLQIDGLYVARVAIVSSADEGAAILVEHLVTVQVLPFFEGRSTVRGFALERHLTGVCPLVLGTL
jgi:hypothetical protein